MWALFARIASAGPTQAQIDAAQWEPLAVADRAGVGRISVLTSRIDGVDCFRGRVTADAVADKLLDVVTDVDSTPRWSSAGISGGEVLSRDATSMVYYQYLDVPAWTLSADRFWFLQGRITRTPERVELDWQPLSPDSPFDAQHQRFASEHSDAIEPPVNVGHWRFEPAPSGVDLTYTVCSLSGGSMPVALQNAATRRTLPDTVADVIAEARRR